MNDHETINVFGTEVSLLAQFSSAAGDLPDIGESYSAQLSDGTEIGEVKSVLAWRWRRELPDRTFDEGLAATRQGALTLMMESESSAKRIAATR